MGLSAAPPQKVLLLLINPSVGGFVKAQMQVMCPAASC